MILSDNDISYRKQTPDYDDVCLQWPIRLQAVLREEIVAIETYLDRAGINKWEQMSPGIHVVIEWHLQIS